MKPVIDRPGPSQTGVWVVLKDGKIIGKVIAAYPQKGHGERPTYCAAFEFVAPYGRLNESAKGYGYDKQGACMEGHTMWGVKMSSNWESDLNKAGLLVEQIL